MAEKFRKAIEGVAKKGFCTQKLLERGEGFPLNFYMQEERIGTHVVGFGIELKYNVNRDSPGIAFPIFILMHGAVGTVINDAHSVDSILDACHWNSTAGIGIKISNAFGVAFRGGILQRTDKSFIPFIALDIGSIAYK